MGVCDVEVYDEAHALARSLRASAEFQRLLKAKDALQREPDKLKRVTEFKAKEFEVEGQRLLGVDLPPEKLEALQRLADLLLLDPVAREYLEAEARFTRLFSDVQKIVLDAVKEWEPLLPPGAGERRAKESESGGR